MHKGSIVLTIQEIQDRKKRQKRLGCQEITRDGLLELKNGSPGIGYQKSCRTARREGGATRLAAQRDPRVRRESGGWIRQGFLFPGKSHRLREQKMDAGV
jgi:hypothetical protein